MDYLTIFKEFALCQAVLNIDIISNALLSINSLQRFAEYRISIASPSVEYRISTASPIR